MNTEKEQLSLRRRKFHQFVATKANFNHNLTNRNSYQHSEDNFTQRQHTFDNKSKISELPNPKYNYLNSSINAQDINFRTNILKETNINTNQAIINNLNKNQSKFSSINFNDEAIQKIKQKWCKQQFIKNKLKRIPNQNQDQSENYSKYRQNIKNIAKEGYEKINKIYLQNQIYQKPFSMLGSPLNSPIQKKKTQLYEQRSKIYQDNYNKMQTLNNQSSKITNKKSISFERPSKLQTNILNKSLQGIESDNYRTYKAFDNQPMIKQNKMIKSNLKSKSLNTSKAKIKKQKSVLKNEKDTNKLSQKDNALLKISNRLKFSEGIYKDSKFANSKHQMEHLSKTYRNQNKIRGQVKNKINMRPQIIKKFKFNPK